jgi:hypothetical protein
MSQLVEGKAKGSQWTGRPDRANPVDLRRRGQLKFPFLLEFELIPQLPPANNTRALYAYESTSPEELSISEDETLFVFSVEDDWLLVRPESDPSSKLGFVPRTYCEPLDESAAVTLPDAEEAEAEIEEHHREEEQAEEQRQLAEQQRQLKLKDKVETWSISEMEGKKKKKGTLGVGNGAVFFASDTDKVRRRSLLLANQGCES